MPLALSDDDKRAVLSEFLSETREHLTSLEQSIVSNEGRSIDRAEMQALFRHVHTLKGSCGWLGFSHLEALTHVVEALLDTLRHDPTGMTTDVASLMLRFVDQCRVTLVTIESSGVEGDPARLLALAEDFQRVQPKSRHVVAPPASSAVFEDEAVHEQTIRVDLSVLDRLMNQVSELVLARNQILQAGLDRQHPTLAGAVQRLNLVTSELQESVMKTRMQPIQTVWGKVPRLVRDLSIDLGRMVKVTFEGSETELDRTLVEAIRSPIMHLIRNSVDHGIEPPNERVLLGKNPEGRLSLRAFHQGGYVNIEVSDDGRGIDPDRVRMAAIERNLIAVDDARALAPQQAMELIFLPGFSTAAEVTHVSGRGVGMDVVRANVEAIGGTIELQSVIGQGTTLRIKIPLTLAIVPALVVVAGGERFAIAQTNLIELVRLDIQALSGSLVANGVGNSGVGTHLESVHDSLLYRLRGQLIPIVALTRELRLAEGRGQYIVIVQAESKTFGLIVDDVRDTEEIVVKPLGKELKNLGVYAGATIMGDGVVALILDVVGLARRASVTNGERRRGVSRMTPDAPAEVAFGRRRSLLFESGSGGRFAVTLDAVSRLEEIDNQRLEQMSDRWVIQYRGGILPLVSVETLLEERRSTPREAESPASWSSARRVSQSTQVIVLSRGEESIGLMVSQILDIVEHDHAFLGQTVGFRRGVVGTEILHGKVCELLDVEWIFDSRRSNGRGDAPVGAPA